MRAPRPSLRVLLLLALALPAARAGAGDGGAAAGPAEADLAALDAPFLLERESALERLIAGLPGTREAVLAEFRRAGGRRKALLARVLAADGSPASLDALLRALPSTTDPATASAIRASLVEHAERVADAVAAWRDAKGDLPPAVADLAGLLRRARVEALFLARKSRTGTTGSYPGQFDVLKPDRALALDVCLGILLDRPVKLPGRFPYGSYHWLRPPAFVVEKTELRYMALHAIGELTTPEDAAVVEELERFHEELTEAVSREVGWPPPPEAGLLQTVLTTLAKLRPETWAPLAEDQIRVLSRNGNTLDDAAAMCMRLRKYDAAVALYRALERLGEGALVPYNLACTYARWSEETDDPERAAERRSLALDALERSRSGGYADWSWMEQDRDLDAVRGDPRFAALLRSMKEEFRGPDRAGAATPPR